jgi:hypothetical protein
VQEHRRLLQQPGDRRAAGRNRRAPRGPRSRGRYFAGAARPKPPPRGRVPRKGGASGLRRGTGGRGRCRAAAAGLLRAAGRGRATGDARGPRHGGRGARDGRVRRPLRHLAGLHGGYGVAETYLFANDAPGGAVRRITATSRGLRGPGLSVTMPLGTRQSTRCGEGG